MAMSETDNAMFDRASARVKDAKLDTMTEESTLNALSASKVALNNPTDELVAAAVSKLTLAFAHYSSGAPRAAAEAATRAVIAHEKNRHDSGGSTTVTTVTTPIPAQKKSNIEAALEAKWAIVTIVLFIVFVIALSLSLQNIVGNSAQAALEQHGQRSRQ